MIQQSSHADSLKIDEVKGLLEIISNYTRSFILLNQFDSDRLEVEKLNENITFEILLWKIYDLNPFQEYENIFQENPSLNIQKKKSSSRSCANRSSICHRLR